MHNENGTTSQFSYSKTERKSERQDIVTVSNKQLIFYEVLFVIASRGNIKVSSSGPATKIFYALSMFYWQFNWNVNTRSLFSRHPTRSESNQFINNRKSVNIPTKYAQTTSPVSRRRPQRQG